jgi:hypothetical protein
MHLQDLTLEQLADLRDHLKQMLSHFDSNMDVFETKGLSVAVRDLGTRHGAKMQGLVSRLADKKISHKKFIESARNEISKSFRAAYEMTKKNLTPGDLEYLRRAVEAEVKFATKFANDIVAGTTHMSIDRRAAMYGRSVEGIGWNASVENQKDDVVIEWKLGDAEHCVSCISLAANSPYTKRNLPTTPRAGDTECASNCKCYLVYRTERKAKRKERPSRSDQGVRQLMRPNPPKGSNRRKATTREARKIADLRARINYNRRLMENPSLTAKQKADAMAARQKANTELIDFLNQRKIYEVPVYSTPEVISGADVGLAAKKQIITGGVNSKTLRLIRSKEANKAIDDYANEVMKMLGSPTEAIEEAKYSTRPVAVKYVNRDRTQGETWVLQHEGVNKTMQLIPGVLRTAFDLDVRVGPLDDEQLAFFGIWIEGSADDVKKILEATDAYTTTEKD